MNRNLNEAELEIVCGGITRMAQNPGEPPSGPSNNKPDDDPGNPDDRKQL